MRPAGESRGGFAALIEWIASPRNRSLLAFAALVMISVAAGYGVYSGHRKILGILLVVTVVVLFRRWRFEDFFFMTIVAATLGHVRYSAIQEEFSTDKWLALFGMGGVSIVAAAMRLAKPAWPRAVHALVLALGLLGVYSVGWSPRPWHSFQKAGVWSVCMIVAFVGAWSYARTQEHVRRVVHAHVLTLWLVFPLGVLALVLGLPGAYEGGRFQSIFENPNNLGEWASQALPLLFVLMIADQGKWWRRCSAVLFVTGVACAVASGSRGGVGGAAIGIALACLLRYPRASIAVLAFVTTVLTFLALYDVGLDRLAGAFDMLVRAETLEDMSERRGGWKLGLFVAAQRPWLGHGFGLGDLLFVDYGLTMTDDFVPPTVHNTYLDTYMNLGLVGLALLVGIQVLAGVSGLRAWRADPRGPSGTLALALLGSVVGTSAHAVVETTLLSVGNPWSLPFWVYVALLVKLGKPDWVEVRAPAKSQPVRDLRVATAG